MARSGSDLQQLSGRAATLGGATGRLRAALDPLVAPHVRVAAASADVLVLSTDAQAWAARLRFMGPEILRQARAAGLPAARHLRVMVDPVSAPAPKPAARPGRSLQRSRRAAAMLDALAGEESSAALGAALRRLAARHRGD